MVKLKIFTLFMLLFAMCLISGCATVVSGKTQAVTFQSRPDNADIYVNGQKLGQTPLVAQVVRGKSTVVNVRLDGYEESTTQLPTKLNPWFFGNVLWSYFSTFGSTTDIGNDASVEYEPNMYFFTLVPSGKLPPMAGLVENNTKLARFIVINYKALGLDLSSEKGEYLDTLIKLLNISNEKRDFTIKRLRDMYIASDSAPSFANDVESEFIPKQINKEISSSAKQLNKAEPKKEFGDFIVVDNNFVQSKSTKLLWTKDANVNKKATDWYAASSAATLLTKKNPQNCSQYRLPSKEEADKLIDTIKSGGVHYIEYIKRAGFTDFKPECYWTGSSSTSNTQQVVKYTFDLERGYTSETLFNEMCYAWLVCEK